MLQAAGSISRPAWHPALTRLMDTNRQERFVAGHERLTDRCQSRSRHNGLYGVDNTAVPPSPYATGLVPLSAAPLTLVTVAIRYRRS